MLCLKRARGSVSDHFPYASQDAICFIVYMSILRECFSSLYTVNICVVSTEFQVPATEFQTALTREQFRWALSLLHRGKSDPASASTEQGFGCTQAGGRRRVFADRMVSRSSGRMD